MVENLMDAIEEHMREAEQAGIAKGLEMAAELVNGYHFERPPNHATITSLRAYSIRVDTPNLFTKEIRALMEKES